MRRPLLIVDGDSFAHRAYHALPKSIRRRGDKGAGAILGFANILLRFYETEKPRAVLVGWDTYDAPTYRNEALASYQSGRTFDGELLEQLDVLPKFIKACGFASAWCAKFYYWAQNGKLLKDVRQLRSERAISRRSSAAQSAAAVPLRD